MFCGSSVFHRHLLSCEQIFIHISYHKILLIPSVLAFTVFYARFFFIGFISPYAKIYSWRKREKPPEKETQYSHIYIEKKGEIERSTLLPIYSCNICTHTQNRFKRRTRHKILSAFNSVCCLQSLEMKKKAIAFSF